MIDNFMVVSTNNIEGAEITEYIGIVQGSTVRSRNVGSDIFANLKNLGSSCSPGPPPPPLAHAC